MEQAAPEAKLLWDLDRLDRTIRSVVTLRHDKMKQEKNKQ